MKPEDSCAAQIYNDVVQESALLDYILQDTCSGTPSLANCESVPNRVDVYVPALGPPVSDTEIMRHEEAMASVRREINVIDAAIRAKLDSVRNDNVTLYEQATRGWEQATAQATRKLQAIEAAFGRAKSRADANLARDSDEIERLRKAEWGELQKNLLLKEPAPGPTLRGHRAQTTTMVTKIAMPPRCYDVADAIVAWLSQSGLQATHAAGGSFDLTKHAGLGPLAGFSKRDLVSLSLALSSTPASSWATLRDVIARYVSVVGSTAGDDGRR